MQNEDVEKLIEQEVEQMRHFLRMAARLGIPEEEIEKQINIYLDKISELRRRMN